MAHNPRVLGNIKSDLPGHWIMSWFWHETTVLTGLKKEPISENLYLLQMLSYVPQFFLKEIKRKRDEFQIYLSSKSLFGLLFFSNLSFLTLANFRYWLAGGDGWEQPIFSVKVMDAAHPALEQFNLDIYLHPAHALHIWVSISHINGPYVLCTM